MRLLRNSPPLLLLFLLAPLYGQLNTSNNGVNILGSLPSGTATLGAVVIRSSTGSEINFPAALTPNGAWPVEGMVGGIPLFVHDHSMEVILGKIATSGNMIRGPLGNPAQVVNGALAVYQLAPPPSYDPCAGSMKMNIAVSTNANAQLISGVTGKSINICGGVLIVTTAGSFSLIEGTGSVCATNIQAVVGSTTAANGMPLAANGGFLLGGGQATFARTTLPGNNLCILLTGTGIIAGNILYAY